MCIRDRDTAVCSGQVLAGGIQVVDGVLQTVLESPEGCTGLGHTVDSIINNIDGCASGCLVGNIYTIQAQSCSVHIACLNGQHIEILIGIALSLIHI